MRSAFASRKGHGLPWHYDATDSFVCQVSGEKTWRLAANTHVESPTVGYAVGWPPNRRHRAEAPFGLPTKPPEPDQTLVMKEGQVLFLPRGTWHEVETTGDQSLHCNVRVVLPTWRELLTVALECPEFMDDPALRASVPHAFNADTEMRPTVKEEMSELLLGLAATARENLDAGSFLQRLAEMSARNSNDELDHGRSTNRTTTKDN